MATPSWLNKRFLEDTLRSGLKDCDLRVSEFVITEAVKPGENFASELLRVVVQCSSIQSGKQKRQLIIKLIPDDPHLSGWLVESGVFENEIQFYEKVLPAIKYTCPTFDLTPMCFPCTRLSTLVMEDISAYGYKMADRCKQLDYAHSSLAIKSLAQFHAASYLVHREKPQLIERYIDNSLDENNFENTACYYEISFRSLADAMETWDSCSQYAGILRKIPSKVIQTLERLTSPKYSKFCVLNHGDVWTNNVLFRYDPLTGQPTSVKFLDFQMLKYASPACDLHYFFTTSVQEDLREELTEQLLKDYYRALVSHIPFGAPSFQDLLDEMKDKEYLSFIYSVLALCYVLSEPGEAPDFTTVSEEDYQKLHVPTMIRAQNGKFVKRVLQKRLPNFERKGFLKL